MIKTPNLLSPLHLNGLSIIAKLVGSLFKRAQSIARRYNEPLLSIEDDLSNVFQDSAGTLPATVGSPIGLLTDRAFGGELGVELAIPANIGGSFVNNGDGSYTKPVGADGTFSVNGNTVPSGNHVRFRFEVVAVTGNITPYVAGAIQSTITTIGPKEYNAASGLSTVTEASIYCAAANSVTIRNISVRELKGNHATQSTAGNRPVQAQVPKRLGVELNTVVNNNGYFINPASTGIVTDGTNTKTTGWVPVQSGKTYRFLPNGTANRRRCQFLALNGVTERYATEISADTSPFGYFTIPANVSAVRIYFAVQADMATSLSVREVLEWTNAASFNGTTNSMQLAVNPIGPNLSQPYTIIVAGVCGALGAGRAMCGDRSRVFRFTETNSLRLAHFNTGGIQSSFSLGQGQPFVAIACWDGANGYIYLNGELVASSAFPAPSASVSTFFAGQDGYNGQFFNGQITAVTAFDRVLTDSERTIIGKAFARELGVTYG